MGLDNVVGEPRWYEAMIKLRKRATQPEAIDVVFVRAGSVACAGENQSVVGALKTLRPRGQLDLLKCVVR